MKRIITLALTLVMGIALCACGINHAKDVEKMIDNIGQVTIDSKTAIDEIEKKYNELTDEEKAKIDNYETFEQAKNDYNEVLKSDMLEKAEPLYYETLVAIEDEYLKNMVRAKEIYDGKIVTYMGVIGGREELSIDNEGIYSMYLTPNGTNKFFESTCSLMRINLPYDNLSDLNEWDLISCVGTLEVGRSLSINDAFLIDDSLNKYEH